MEQEITREVAEAALLSASHSFANAAERWAKRREQGLSDDELQKALAFEFGIFGGGRVRGFDGWDQLHTGESAPKLWVAHGFVKQSDKPTFAGKRLIDFARDVLDIPLPGGIKQERLF